MAFNIDEFKSQLGGGGARPNLFRVQLLNPIDPSADTKLSFMVKATAIPASTVGTMEVPFMGKKVKFGGDRTFAEEWSVTVINDEDFAVRNALESWSNAIHTHSSNLRATPDLYKSQGQVIQLNKNLREIREYTFEGIFPTTISSIQLSWETNDTIEEFECSFAYDQWRITGGATGNSTT